MVLEFDEAKRARHLRERAIGFERFADMDVTRALSREDARADYDERRVTLLGPIDNRLQAVITFREARVRVISLRRANRREERQYAQESQPP